MKTADNGIDVEEIVRDYQIRVDVDQILTCQGADPASIRRRRPDIIRMTEEALAREWHLVSPVLLSRYYVVSSFNDGILFLEGGGTLEGPVITQNLAVAEAVVVMIGTVGPDIDRRISESFSEKPSYALAVDGLGTASADALRNAAASAIKEEAESRGWKLSRYCSPGMVGWEIREGQRQIFSLLKGEKIGVDLMFSGQMTPQKSISGVLGLGSRVEQPTGPPCQFCSSRKTCLFQDRYKEKS
jgi:hypothetical protein